MYKTVIMYLLSLHPICQAVQERRAEVKEASQEVVPTQANKTLPGPTPKRVPVGGSISSIHVDYNYFEVGTGQVKSHVYNMAVWSDVD